MFHDFNTSHVNVNHLIKIFNNLTKKHFNTSHVNVNLLEIHGQNLTIAISIHLMLMLIIILS